MLAAMTALVALALSGAPTVSRFTDKLTGQTLDARIDPATYAVVAEVPRSGGLPSDMAAKRATFDTLAKDLGGAPETVLRIEDLKAGNVPIRLYRPDEGRVPALLFTHGALRERRP